MQEKLEMESLPYDIDIEMEVLGTLILTLEEQPNILNDISELLPCHFYRNAHQKVFDGVLTLKNNGIVVNLLTLTDLFKRRNELDEVGGAAYLASLTDIFANRKALTTYAELIKEKALRRQVYFSAESIARNSCDEENFSFPALLANWDRKLKEIEKSYGRNKQPKKIDVDFDELMLGFLSTPTHLEELNAITGGLPNDLTIILGQTSMGKTSLALGFLQKLLFEEKLPVVYFGPQIKPGDIPFRIFCSKGQISAKDIKRGRCSEKERKILRLIYEEIKTLPLFVYTMSERMSAIDIAATVRNLAEKEKEKPSIVVIENLQQLIWPEKIGKRHEELEIITSHLKALADDLQVPVVISSQIKKEVDERKSKRPMPSDASGTSEIERLARSILALYREDYYCQKTQLGWQTAEIAVYKDGEPAVLSVEFNPATLTWRDKQ
jgi:replicative DNA helicase